MGTASGRVRAEGKFLFQGDRKLYVRGVTYGTFAPNDDGVPYPAADVVERDFARMASAGLNAVRVYTVPPRWLLDLADDYGLKLLIDIPWSKQLCVLDSRKLRNEARQAIRNERVPPGYHGAIQKYFDKLPEKKP